MKTLLVLAFIASAGGCVADARPRPNYLVTITADPGGNCGSAQTDDVLLIARQAFGGAPSVIPCEGGECQAAGGCPSCSLISTWAADKASRRQSVPRARRSTRLPP